MIKKKNLKKIKKIKLLFVIYYSQEKKVHIYLMILKELLLNNQLIICILLL